MSHLGATFVLLAASTVTIGSASASGGVGHEVQPHPRAQGQGQRETTTEIQVGIAANNPIAWTGSVGVSGYVGFAGHHAIRGNFATHEAGFADGIGTLIGDLFFDGDGSEASYDGQTTDIGLSYQFYPRAVFSGLFVEAGVMRRAYDEHVVDEYAAVEDRHESGTAYMGRGQIGWSWRLGEHAFIAAAIGASAGRFKGTLIERQSSWDAMAPVVTTTYSDVRVTTEAYLRIGGTFGM